MLEGWGRSVQDLDNRIRVMYTLSILKYPILAYRTHMLELIGRDYYPTFIHRRSQGVHWVHLHSQGGENFFQA